MEFLTNPVFLWLITAAILLVLEFILPGVLIIFFSFGALVLMLLIWIFPNLPLNIQLIIFLTVSILSLLFLRRHLKELLRVKETSLEEDDEVIGKIVTVIVDISPNSPGRISLNGTEWSAESPEKCSAGERVIITGRESLVLKVKKDI